MAAPIMREERQLLGGGVRRELDPPPVADPVLGAKLGDEFSNRFPERLRQVRAVRIEPLIALELLRPVMCERLEEVLASTRLQVEQVRPQAGRARLARRPDDILQLL